MMHPNPGKCNQGKRQHRKQRHQLRCRHRQSQARQRRVLGRGHGQGQGQGGVRKGGWKGQGGWKGRRHRGRSGVGEKHGCEKVQAASARARECVILCRFRGSSFFGECDFFVAVRRFLWRFLCRFLCCGECDFFVDFLVLRHSGSALSCCGSSRLPVRSFVRFRSYW